MDLLKKFATTIVRILFNPISFISWTSLIFYNISIKFIRAQIGIPYGKTCEAIKNDIILSDSIKDIGCMLNDPNSYAMIDYAMQILMLLVATILSINMLFTRSSRILNYPLNSKFWSEFHNHSYSFWFYLLSLFLFGALIILFITGWFANVDIIFYYLPENMIITGGTRWPPMKSPITYARLIVGIYGFLLTLYFKFRHKEFLNNLKTSFSENATEDN